MKPTAYPQLGGRQRNVGLAIRNSAYGLASLSCRLIGNTFAFVLIARLPGLTPAGFGLVSYGAALASILILVAQFGLLPLMIRDTAERPNRFTEIAESVLSLRLLLAMACLCATPLYLIAVDMPSDQRLVCYVVVAAYFLGSFSLDLQAFFQSREKMHLELAGIVAENFLLLVLTALAFLRNAADPMDVACILAVAKGVGLVVNYRICASRLQKVLPKLNLTLWRAMLIDALPFALAGILATGIVQLDTILMRELLISDVETQIGLYQVASRLFLIPMLLPEVAVKVFLPQLSRMHGRLGTLLSKDLGRLNNVLLTAGLLITIMTVVRANDVVDLIYGGRYADAGPVLQVLALSIVMRFGAAYNLYFTVRNKVWFRVYSAIVALSSVVVLNVWLVPRYGLAGAAYATVVAHLVYWLPYLIALFHAEGTVRLGWNVAGAMAAGVVLFLIMKVTAKSSLLFIAPLYIVVGAAGVLLTMSKGDRTLVLGRIGFGFRNP